MTTVSSDNVGSMGIFLQNKSHVHLLTTQKYKENNPYIEKLRLLDDFGKHGTVPNDEEKEKENLPVMEQPEHMSQTNWNNKILVKMTLAT
jgi:hypothetical protein